MQSAVSIAWKSIVIALIVLGLKIVAARLSDSVALYSDAVESVVNVVTAIAALAAIIYAARPPDANHPFGHEKAEYFVAMVEAVLIGAAAFAILSQAWFSYQARDVLDVPATAFGANFLASVINGFWCALLIRRGREMRSTALEADGWHLFADVFSSIGVLAGIIAAKVTGITILDPIMAVLVAANILWSGWKLMKTSVLGLMDTAPDQSIIDAIAQVITNEGNGALEAHDLRVRISGPITFVEFHLVVDGNLSVNHAHEICDRIEISLMEEFPNSRINIHVEPESKAKKHNSIQI